MKAELLLAKEDRTWDTVVVDTPFWECDEPEMVREWAEKTMAGQAQYRDVVLFAVYCFPYGDEV